MIGLIIIVLSICAVWLALKRFHKAARDDVRSPKTSARLDRLWQHVSSSWQSGSLLAAEKGLLSILQIDHKNTAAYNRLGILYARQHNYEDAIECFDIASSLTPTLSTLYNLGLVQYEFGNFDKAAAAFERVIDLEPNPRRYLAYAKALEKLGNDKKTVDVLRKVVEAEATPQHLELLAQAYDRIKNHKAAETLRDQVSYNDNRQKTEFKNASGS